MHTHWIITAAFLIAAAALALACLSISHDAEERAEREWAERCARKRARGTQAARPSTERRPNRTERG